MHGHRTAPMHFLNIVSDTILPITDKCNLEGSGAERLDKITRHRETIYRKLESMI